MTCAHGVNVQLKMMDWRDMSLSICHYRPWISSISNKDLSSQPEWGLCVSFRMASPLWQWPSSRAMTRLSHCCWRTTPRAKFGCLPCTSPPARMTQRLRLCCCRMTTMQTLNQRWVKTKTVDSSGPSFFMPMLALFLFEVFFKHETLSPKWICSIDWRRG